MKLETLRQRVRGTKEKGGFSWVVSCGVRFEMGYRRSVHGDRECLVVVDGAKRVKLELRNGFDFGFGLRWERRRVELTLHQKREGSSLFRCEAEDCGGDALTRQRSDTVLLCCVDYEYIIYVCIYAEWFAVMNLWLWF